MSDRRPVRRIDLEFRFAERMQEMSSQLLLLYRGLMEDQPGRERDLRQAGGRLIVECEAAGYFGDSPELRSAILRYGASGDIGWESAMFVGLAADPPWPELEKDMAPYFIGDELHHPNREALLCLHLYLMSRGTRDAAFRRCRALIKPPMASGPVIPLR